ncbi:alpha/beta fold hydrolase [Pseudoalteromonas holothuriae]|nr:alpha/beta hydrolase [Pseudoalteromonas sp. CIP111854]
MKIKTITLVGCLSTFTMQTNVFAESPLLKNEQKIEFVTNSGEKTDAIEGHLMVPENRNSPNSRMIRINYVRFTATGKSKRSPIVYLSGGPGGSGIATAKWRRFPLFMALREYGDVIAFEQRGTGRSEQPQTCSSSVKIPLDERLNKRDFKSKYTSAANECLRLWESQGIDTSAYNTIQNAYDIDSLRVHLQADKVSLWGISYGSHLALAAIKLFENKLDKVIIASAEGLNQTVKLPAMTDQYFKNVQEVIDQQALKSTVPDLTALMKRVHSKLEKSPIMLTIPSRDGSKTNILFQKHHMRMLASMMIADPNQYLSMLVHMYLEIEKDNTDLLMGILQRGIFKDETLSFKLMPLVMDVASGITSSKLKLFNQQAKDSLLGDMLNYPMPMLNEFSSGLDLGDEFRQAPKSSVPTLLLTGTLDGRTYPQEQLEAVRGLSNLIQVKVKYAGHNLFTSSEEVLARMKAFLANEKVDQSTIELPLPDLSLKQ